MFCSISIPSNHVKINKNMKSQLATNAHSECSSPTLQRIDN